MLIAEGLTKRYGDAVALDGFDLTVQAGEIVGLVGHNGAGKTSFVEVVSGLTRPDTGSVTIDGVDVLRGGGRRVARRRLGVAPQEIALYPGATVRENVRIFGALAGVRGEDLRRATEDVVEELQLTAVLDRSVGVLSGGQQRRTQAATAMVARPALLLLDEPTAGADPQTRAALLAAVRARAAAGAAVLYTTHYLPELAELGAGLALARSGRIVARGPQDELLGRLPGTVRIAADRRLGLDDVSADLRARSQIEDGELLLTSVDPAADLARLLAGGVVPVSVDVRRADLDDLYDSLSKETSDVR